MRSGSIYCQRGWGRNSGCDVMWYIGQAATLGRAWEALVKKCWKNGRKIYTEYEESSIDLSPGGIVISKPLAEPVVHKAVFAWHKKDGYVEEVIHGKDIGRIGKDWHYTYWQRLFMWPLINSQVKDALFNVTNPNVSFAMDIRSRVKDIWVDQIKYIARKLTEAPHSRRAQATTWHPVIDEPVDGPPCLQRVWCRVVDGKLEMHTYWRSRDLWKAWWLNAYAMISLQKYIVSVLQENGVAVEIGRYTDISSSLHIYERNWIDVGKSINIIHDRSYKDKYMWGVGF